MLILRKSLHNRSAAPLAIVVALVLVVTPARAVLVSHTPISGSNPAPFSPPGGSVASGDEAGTRYIDFGVDYMSAVAVATFDDPPAAFGGVTAGGILDLFSPVNGRVVVLGTTSQGLTNYVSVTAGNVEAPGNLLLEVFDINSALLQSVPNPTFGSPTFSISRGSADIAFFRVSTPVGDSFGVNNVTIETPLAAEVPEPTSVAMFALIGAIGVFCRRFYALGGG